MLVGAVTKTRIKAIEFEARNEIEGRRRALADKRGEVHENGEKGDG